MFRISKKVWLRISLLLFLMIGAYYFAFTSHHHYLGVEADFKNGNWRVTDIHNGGLAKETELSEGDLLLKIDQQESQKNVLLNKWLIVEQAKSVLVERNHQEKQIVFKGNQSFKSLFLIFEAIAFVLLVWAILPLKKDKTSRSSKRYSLFLIATAFFLSSLIPSSMGDTLGRLFVVLYITLLPFFIDVFWRASILKEAATKLSLFSRIVMGYSLVTVLIFILVQEFSLPLIFVKYLSGGIFYVSFSFLLILAALSLVKDYSSFLLQKVNLILLTLLSLIPLFIGYVFPLPYDLPFSCTIPLLFLPITGAVNHLIVNRLTVTRTHLPLPVVYVLEAIVSTFVMISFAVMMKFMPIWLVAIYCFLFILCSLPIIKDFMDMAKQLNYRLDGQIIFSAVEMEREDIAITIHDTIIQEVIYHKKQIESAGDVDKSEVLNTLDDVVFELRELCSNIYPLMIKELGLKNAILELLNKFQKEEPVTIEHEMAFDSYHFESRVSNFILRSIKELITNSILHGNAKQIKLAMVESEEQLIVEVSDDGKFIERSDDHKNHFGLDVIAEKLALLGGELQIEKSPTKVRMLLPKGDKNDKNSSD